MARLVIGLGLTALTLVFAGRRVWWLYALIRSGQPTHGRTSGLGARLRTQLVEVFGQRRLLRWTIPGLAHFFTFWGFVILITVYVEAYGALFDEGFAIPLIGHWPVLGFAQDAIALAVLVSTSQPSAPSRSTTSSRAATTGTLPTSSACFVSSSTAWRSSPRSLSRRARISLAPSEPAASLWASNFWSQAHAPSGSLWRTRARASRTTKCGGRYEAFDGDPVAAALSSHASRCR